MDKKISELDQALQINNDAVFPFSQDNSGTETTYKASITQLASEIGEDQTYSNLQTTSKNLVGAINEVAQGGGGGGGSSNANIAPDYDSTATYDVGDWCIYNGTLYQCTTAITVAEAFDPTHWTAKKVVDAFDDIDTELSGKVETSNFYGSLLPMSPNDTDKVADRITALENNFTLSGLNDTVITSPQATQMLQYENIGGQIKLVNTSRNAIRHTTVSGTTDGTGDILCSDLPLSSYQILSAYKNRTISGQSAVGYCILGGNNQTYPYIHLIKSDNTSLASTAVTIEVYYVEI